MFDGVTYREGFSRQLRLGPGAILGICFYVGIGAFSVWYQSRPHEATSAVPVTFRRMPPPPPPPPAGGGGGVPKEKPKPKTVVPIKKDAIIAPTVIPEVAPQQTAQDSAPAEAGGAEGGVAGGVAGGVVGGQVGGVVGGQLGGDGNPIEWDGSRMSDPVFVSGPKPECTDAAFSKNVKGTMLIRCVVTTDGHVHDCKAVKGLPFMSDAAMSALEQRVYKPATLGGRPVDVFYVFKLSVSCTEE
ncbi:MAG: energy transducer TonB [Anaeromyxobacteraceae bacterium]